MTKRLATFTSRLAIYLFTALALAACGGGGGGGDSSFLGGGTGDTNTYYLSVSLLDPDGNPTNNVTTASPGTLQVTVTKNKASGAPVTGTVITVSADVEVLINGGAGEGTQISDAAGMASFRVEAGQSKGAGTLTVSVVDENNKTVTKTLNFQLGAVGLRLGYFDGDTFIEGQIGITPDGTLAAEGQAVLSVAIVDADGKLAESKENIAFSSACLSSGDAAVSPLSPAETVTGQLSVNYLPNGCSGTDSITATLVGSGAAAYGSIDVAPPSANGLTFVSADPALIVLKGTGGGPNRIEKSKVTFRAVDGNNQPSEGVEVHFSLTTDVGGLFLTPAVAVSNADGEVSTVVSSGDVATVVRVIATSDSGDGVTQVSAVSDVLTVSTGLPDQNSISLSVEKSFVVEEGMTKDGVTRAITVRMADKFNNPVPDGTAALFTTEYGSIEPSCETVNGACSVTWVSQAPRYPTLQENQNLVKTINDLGCPSHPSSAGPCPEDLGYIRGGRSTVLVTAIGEESFIDRNGNGIYDQSEADEGLFSNLTEAFIDNNEDGLWDPGTTACINNPNTLTCKSGSEETFVDFNNNQMFDANGDDPGNGYPNQGEVAVYNGLLCPEEGDGVWCSRELVNVYASTVLILSADPNWDIGLYLGTANISNNSTVSPNTYNAYISDIFNNKPPAGSTVSVDASGDCAITGKSSFEVPNTTAPGAFAISFTTGGEGGAGGELTITLTPQGGGPDYSESWPCSTPLPPDPNDLVSSP